MFEPIFGDMELVSFATAEKTPEQSAPSKNEWQDPRALFLEVNNFEYANSDVEQLLADSDPSRGSGDDSKEAIGQKRLRDEEQSAVSDEPIGRKQAHKEHSRKYRANVGNKFKELTDLVVTLDSETATKPQSKSRILQTSLRLIREYKQAVITLDMEVALSSHKNMLSWVDRVVQQSDCLFTALCPMMKLVCKKRRWKYAEVWLTSVTRTDSVMRLRLKGAHIGADFDNGYSSVELFKETSRKVSFEPGVGLIGRVYKSMAAETLTNLSNPEVFIRAGTATRYGIQTGFAVPVAVSGKCEGVVSFFDTEQRGVEADSLNLANNIAGYIGLSYGAKLAKMERKKLAKVMALPNRP
ncbi:hypothetical protein NDN08_001146 [Rhodosorus marinus]|uniref:BHLH domain-containing protein n=1 Tax=Rhodosorus marinus TaxID=101924 RepID=A0AAV8UU68_9RHOD|nr:hypothetical protein NDN08_001146 [Rhodosorus marinus]